MMTAKKIGKPLAFETAEKLSEAIDNYFESDAYIPDKEGKPEYLPTMSGLALSIGVDRRTIVNYSNREDYFPTIKRARAKIEAFVEARLYGNNVTGCIFNLKNNFDWKDKSEVAQTNIEITHEQWLESLE